MPEKKKDETLNKQSVITAINVVLKNTLYD